MRFKGNLDGQLGRWLVALLLLPPLLWSILSDHLLLFYFVILIIGLLIWWEYSLNLFGKERMGLFILGGLGWAAVAGGAYFFGPEGQQAGLVLALTLGAGYTLRLLEKQPGPVILNLLGRYGLGHLYISFLLSFLLMTRKLDSGEFWLIYLLIVTVAGDTAAYYVGRYLQGPKLYPPASPNKTLSGLAGGLFGSMVASALSAGFLPSQASWPLLAAFGLFLGFWGALGDLFESSIKRLVGIKDSSNILLGHGGFWDRLDAAMFNAAPVYIFANHIMNRL